MTRRHVSLSISFLVVVAIVAGLASALANSLSVSSQHLDAISASTSLATTTTTAAAPAPTAIVTANNGATTDKPETNDTTTITFSQDLDTTTMCAGWTGTALALTFKFFNNSGISGDDTLAYTSGNCPTAGTPHFGTIDLGRSDWVTTSSSTAALSITYSNRQLTLKFTASPSPAISPSTTTMKLSYTGDANMKGTSGVGVSTSILTQSTAGTAW